MKSRLDAARDVLDDLLSDVHPTDYLANDLEDEKKNIEDIKTIYRKIRLGNINFLMFILASDEDDVYQKLVSEGYAKGEEV